MNITRKPQTKNRSVLNINPTSAETVVSALTVLVKLNNINKLNENVEINLKKFVIINSCYKNAYSEKILFN
tara:strand:+ start:541 stop:753 length:213 start_codon:yes stop_codon:yes gene_type:complete